MKMLRAASAAPTGAVRLTVCLAIRPVAKMPRSASPARRGEERVIPSAVPAAPPKGPPVVIPNPPKTAPINHVRTARSSVGSKAFAADRS